MMDVINHPCWKLIYVSKSVKGGPSVSWSTVAMALTMTNTETFLSKIKKSITFIISVLRFYIHSLCNPRDHCTHSLCQDCYAVELITSNLPTYLHMGITLWLGVVLYALVPETMHGIIVGKRVRTRQLSDRYCTRVWMSGMFWCDQ